jgi:sulfopyruvate decarboxylase subunit alpha
MEKIMFSGDEIAATVQELGYTHVIWLPDSAMGPWEAALESCDACQLLRICREGEAWPIAAGLFLGGMRPLVMMQTTGLFESGDAFRNVVFDLQIPVQAIIGARSWLVKGTKDSAKRFTQPILEAWGIDYTLIETKKDKPKLIANLRRMQDSRITGFVLMGEGRL